MTTPLKKQKQLTYEQAKELKWFCSNVAGVRNEMYNTMDTIVKFETKIKRLEKTCEMIEKFLGEKIEPNPNGVFE